MTLFAAKREPVFKGVLAGALFSILLGFAAGALFPSRADSFASPVNYALGVAGVAGVSGDFDRDAIPDIAVANAAAGTVSILLGNGNGTFAAAVDYPAGTDVQGIATADFDHDGDLDLALTDKDSDTVAILIGAGDGTFATAVTYAVGAEPVGVLVHDFNHDGNIDLGVVNSADPSFSTLFGVGDGTFAAATSYLLSGTAYAIAILDTRHTGNADMIVADYQNSTVEIFDGRVDGSFDSTPLVSVTVGAGPNAIALGDVDHNGFSDIVTANETGDDVSVLLADATGIFSANDTTSFSVGNGPMSVVLSDITRDGDLDLTIASSLTDEILTYSGNGEGSFFIVTAPTVGDEPWALVSGDFNRDGADDIASANRAGNNVSVLLNDGSAGDVHLRLPSTISGLQGPSGIVALNLNNDGYLDLAVSDTNNDAIKLYTGTGTSFTSGGTLFTGASPAGLASGDFNRDGVPDLAVATSGLTSISVFIGQGAGAFDTEVTYTVGSAPNNLSLADLNHDGALDIIVAVNQSDAVGVLLGVGDGTFGAVDSYTVGTNPYSVAIADFDGDGVLDIAAVNNNSSNYSILIGQGDGTFAAAATHASPFGPTVVKAADLNRDGIQDLVFGGQQIRVLLGNGDGTFGTATLVYGTASPISLQLDDFTKDGFVDIITTLADSSMLAIFPGNGDGTFDPRIEYSTEATPINLAAADFNNSGVLGVVTTNLVGNSLSVFFGTNVANILPDEPSDLGPAGVINATTIVSRTPEFSFTLSDSDVGNLVRYQIEVSTQADFSDIVVDYTSEFLAQGTQSFTVGQAPGAGVYSVGAEGMELTDNSYYWQVTATDSDGGVSTTAVATGTPAFIVNHGPVDHFVFDTPLPSPILVDTPFSVTITAKDSAENTVTDFTGTVSMLASGGTLTPSTSDAFVDGVLTQEVSIDSPQNDITIDVDDGSGHVGTSDVFDVTGAVVVTNVSSATADGAYKAGDIIVVQVDFSDAVTVTGAPYVLLDTRVGGGQALFNDGSGTASLLFSYTIQAGDSTANLDYVDTASLVLNGGTISDSLDTPATLDLPTPGQAGSLSANNSIEIDTQAPTLTETTPIASLISDSNPVYEFQSDEGGAVSYTGSCGDGDVVMIADNTPTQTTFSALGDGSYNDCEIFVTDAVGNVSSALGISAFTIDTVSPDIVSIDPVGDLETNAATVEFSVEFTESVTGLDVGDFVFTRSEVTGASVADIDGSGTLYTVTVSTGTGDGFLYLDFANDNSVVDAAGNTMSGDVQASAGIEIDKTAPILTDAAISISGATGTGDVFKVGDTVTASWDTTVDGETDVTAVTVNFSEFGGSTIAATLAGNIWSASYVLSGSSELTDLNVTVTATDNVGNSDSAASTANVALDTIPPAAVTALPAAGALTLPQSVALSQGGALAIYYTIDSSTPDCSSTLYATPINIAVATTIKAATCDAVGNVTVSSFAYTPLSVSSGGGSRFVPILQDRSPVPEPSAVTIPIPTPTPIVAPTRFVYTFKTPLGIGARGEAVRALQKYLNQVDFTVAAQGPGSVGNETIFFGFATRAALARFQEAHFEQILKPAGLTKGTGFLGFWTLKYINGQ